METSQSTGNKKNKKANNIIIRISTIGEKKRMKRKTQISAAKNKKRN